MNYSLFKLKFKTAVHLGLSDSALSLYTSGEYFCADTLFSALCHTALSLYGASGVEKLCDQVRKGDLLFSDSMPWKKEIFYLPKPILLGNEHGDVPEHFRKKMKQIKWVPVSAYPHFFNSIDNGILFNAEEIDQSFTQHVEITKIAHPNSSVSTPFQVGVTYFYPDTGLYIIAAYSDPEQEIWLRTLLDALGLSGIGGKISSGYGKFFIEDQIYLNEYFDEQTQWLFTALSNSNAARQILLTASLPSEDEMEIIMPKISYQLIRRGGFIRPEGTAEYVRKKRTQYFFSAGSVSDVRYQGSLYEVGKIDGHSVYRYGKPLFLGVS